MRQVPLVAIAHPTDFSEASAEAFAHALRLALEFRCRLDLLHVRSGDGEWSSFPHVRETLARWELLPADADHAQVQEKLGIEIRKIEIEHQDPLRGVAAFLLSHRPDLVVMATRGAQGLSRFMSESVSEGIAQKTNLPALFLGPNARPFVELEKRPPPPEERCYSGRPSSLAHPRANALSSSLGKAWPCATICPRRK